MTIQFTILIPSIKSKLLSTLTNELFVMKTYLKRIVQILNKTIQRKQPITKICIFSSNTITNILKNKKRTSE